MAEKSQTPNDGGRVGDREIRFAVLQMLCAENQGSSKSAFLEEVRIPRPSARLDILAISDCLCGYEIKSDLDTLHRLRWQANAFNASCDRINIVTTERHASRVLKTVDPWWGVVVFSNQQLVLVRPASENPVTKIECQLFMLAKKELQEIFRAIGPKTSLARWQHAQLVDGLRQFGRIPELEAHIRKQFSRRAIHVS